MSGSRFIVGDVFAIIATLEDASVDLVLTSPPFLALRSYLPPDHPDKGKEIGAEPTPADYIDTLLDVVEAVIPKLAPHGSICIELGDTYAGSGGAGGDYNSGGLRDGQQRFDGSASRAFGTGAAPRPARSGRPKYQDGLRDPKNLARGLGNGNGQGKRSRPAGGGVDRDADEGAGIIPQRTHGHAARPGWPTDKSLCGIPEAFRLSLIWGRNILREPMSALELLWWIDDLRAQGHSAEAALAAAAGWVVEHGIARRTTAWRARNVIRWCRPNPPVGSLADKVRPATSDMVIACLHRKRYFDLDAVRTPNDRVDEDYVGRRRSHEGDRPELGGTGGAGVSPQNELGAPQNELGAPQNELGAPQNDHWWHDETFDQDAWIVSTAPYKGSHYATWPPDLLVKPVLTMAPVRVCRTCGKPSERISEPIAESREELDARKGRKLAPKGERPNRVTGEGAHGDGTILRTVGWTDCGHQDWRPGLVLDPFAGSGTTLMVANGHGRDAIGIDLDHRNADLARQRCGMFLTVEDASDPAPDRSTVDVAAL